VVPFAFALRRFSAFSLTRLKKSANVSIYPLPSGVEYTITTSRVSDMFNTHMQSLLDISVADNLLHGDSDGALCDVEYYAGLSVVELVWQTLLLSRVTDDIDNVADFVCFELVCQNGLSTGEVHKCST
jgi:hypothetical protein